MMMMSVLVSMDTLLPDKRTLVCSQMDRDARDHCREPGQRRHRMADRDVEKKKQPTARKADSGGNMGAGKSGKEGMGNEKPSDEPGLGSQKPGQPRSSIER
jgi:hypothetical protein